MGHLSKKATEMLYQRLSGAVLRIDMKWNRE
jgi:hypothetical protein